MVVVATAVVEVVVVGSLVVVAGGRVVVVVVAAPPDGVPTRLGRGPHATMATDATTTFLGQMNLNPIDTLSAS